MRKRTYLLKLSLILLFVFMFSSCEFPYIDFSNTFEDKGVSFENFLLLDDGMSLRKIKYGLEKEPLIDTSEEFTTYVFSGDGNESINLVLDSEDIIYSKYYSHNNQSLEQSSFDKFNDLRPEMTLAEVENILGVEGVLERVNYLDYSNQKIGSTYIWGIEGSSNKINCIFDENDKMNCAIFDNKIDENKSNSEISFIESGYEKLDEIPLGSNIQAAELILESEALLYSMGNTEEHTSSSYYKFVARDTSSNNVFDIDIFTDGKGRITKKALYFGEEFEFKTTASKLSAYVDGIEEGMTYDEVKELMGGDGLLYLSQTKPQLVYEMVQPPLLTQFIRTLGDVSAMCNNLSGDEDDYYPYIEIYDWNRSNFQINVKFIEGKVASFTNSHVFNDNYYDNEYYSNNGKGTLSESMQIDDTIREKAHSLISDCTTDREKAYRLYDYVSNHIIYDYDIFPDPKGPSKYPEDKTPGAMYGYYNRSGVCFEYSCLYGAMLLEVGIYTRLVDNSDDEDGSHLWNQYYDTDTNTWIPVDCTWKLFDFIEDDVESHYGPSVLMEYSNFK